MIISPLNTINVNKIRYQKQNGCSVKNHSAQTFTANKFPTGVYSDWFTDLIKNKISLPKQEFESWTREHLSEFRTSRETQEGILASIFSSLSRVDGDVKVRENDINALKSNLQKGHNSEPVTSHIDAEYWQYSSTDDYTRQNPNPNKSNWFSGGGDSGTRLSDYTGSNY